MMYPSNRLHLLTPIYYVSGTILSVMILASPVVVLAHAGHGDEFHNQSTTTQSTDTIQVDAQTAKRLGLKVEAIKRQQLEIGIKTTGQIEALPSKKVEVTTPISGAKIVEILVKPGASVKAAQPVAVVSASDLVELQVNSQEKRAEATGELQQAQADLKLAREDLERQRQIAEADIAQARTEVEVSREKYDRDRDLASAGALPRRQMLESQAHLRAGEAELTKAMSRRDVLEAEAQIKRAEAAVVVAQSRLRLSDTTYQTRLQQLGTAANAQGLVTVTAPISGTISDTEVTLGQTFQDAGGKLMTIVNDNRVYATANIYEKDLDKVKMGQRVRVKVANLPNHTFQGKITFIGSVVERDTRVVPVKAELDNSGGQLKPGMFAELEVLTNQTSTAILAIPNSAVVDANGKKLVYVQNGSAYLPVEVTLGQTSGDRVEVKTGLFEGDVLVTQRAPQLYAQSLRGGSVQGKSQKAKGKSQEEDTATPNSSPWWLVGATGGIAIAAGSFWLGRRSKPSDEKIADQTSNGSKSAKGSGELPESHIEQFCELPVLAEKNHHYSDNNHDH